MNYSINPSRQEKVKAVKDGKLFPIVSRLNAIKMAERAGLEGVMTQMYTRDVFSEDENHWEWQGCQGTLNGVLQAIACRIEYQDLDRHHYDMVGDSYGGWCYAPDFIKAVSQQGWVRLAGDIIPVVL